MKQFHIVYNVARTVSAIKYFEDDWTADDVERAVKDGAVDFSDDDVIDEGPLQNLKVTEVTD